MKGIGIGYDSPPVGDSQLSFDQLARDLTQKVSQLFQANVLVLDENGTIVNEDCGAGEYVPKMVYSEPIDQALRIPFDLNGKSGEVIISELPENGTFLSRLVRAIVEMVLNELTLGGATPSITVETELKNRFIGDLLQGRTEDEAAIYERATALGLHLRPPRAVLLIDASEYIKPLAPSPAQPSSAQAQLRAQFIIRTIVDYFHLPGDFTCAYLGNGEIVVLKAADSRSLAPWTDGEKDATRASWASLTALKRAARGLLKHLPGGPGRTFRVGIGRYHPSLKGFASSYQDAQTALSLGRRLGGEKQVYCLDELGIHAFVGVPDERTKIDLALHLLSPLDEMPELMETLIIFLAANSCPSEAASQLFVHRNTVAYRLDKITSLTGLDPRRFKDAVQMQLALVLRAMDPNRAIAQSV